MNSWKASRCNRARLFLPHCKAAGPHPKHRKKDQAENHRKRELTNISVGSLIHEERRHHHHNDQGRDGAAVKISHDKQDAAEQLGRRSEHAKDHRHDRALFGGNADNVHRRPDLAVNIGATQKFGQPLIHKKRADCKAKPEKTEVEALKEGVYRLHGWGRVEGGSVSCLETFAHFSEFQPMGKADFGILGMGLAGAVLAFQLRARGYTVAFADKKLPAAASPIAPGLVNPLAGRKFGQDARLSVWMDTFEAARTEWESHYANRFWHPAPMIRLLKDAAQAKQLERLVAEGTCARWIEEYFPPDSHGPAIADEYGSFLTAQSGWFDIPGFAQCVRKDRRLVRVAVEELPDRADRLIDCRGWRVANDPRWSHLPWSCARGEMLTIELADGPPPHIWNRGIWLQPLGGKRWRVGATYAWDAATFANPPTPEAAATLTEGLSRWLRLPFRIVERSAGVRAVVRDYRPVMGPCPTQSRWHLFSGLGSKGSLLAPFYGRALADFLDAGTPIPPEADIARFG